MGYVANDAVELLKLLAARIEEGGDPLIDMAGDSKRTAHVLRAVAGFLVDRQTVGEYLDLERAKRGPGAQLCLWLGSFGAPEMKEDVLTFRIGRNGHEEHVGILVGTLPYEQLSWWSMTLGRELQQAYARGRADVRREAQEGARGLIEALGLETK